MPRVELGGERWAWFNADDEYYVVTRMGKEVIDESGPFVSSGAALVEAETLAHEFGDDDDDADDLSFTFQIEPRPSGVSVEVPRQ